jgi:hypothetical protein
MSDDVLEGSLNATAILLVACAASFPLLLALGTSVSQD